MKDLERKKWLMSKFFASVVIFNPLEQSKKTGFTEVFGEDLTALGAVVYCLDMNLWSRFWGTMFLFMVRSALITERGFRPDWCLYESGWLRNRRTELFNFGLSRIQDHGLVLTVHTCTLILNWLCPSHLIIISFCLVPPPAHSPAKRVGTSLRNSLGTGLGYEIKYIFPWPFKRWLFFFFFNGKVEQM